MFVRMSSIYKYACIFIIIFHPNDVLHWVHMWLLSGIDYILTSKLTFSIIDLVFSFVLYKYIHFYWEGKRKKGVFYDLLLWHLPHIFYIWWHTSMNCYVLSHNKKKPRSYILIYNYISFIVITRIVCIRSIEVNVWVT
jgi:hypothetical protein